MAPRCPAEARPARQTGSIGPCGHAAGCARTAVQVHGALAQTWEHDIHLFVRHAWQGAAQLGDSRALYSAVGRAFAGGPA